MENRKNFHAVSIDEALKSLNSNQDGLTYEEAELRLKNGHPNEIAAEEKISIFKIISNQIKDVMVLVLLLAAVISFFMGERISAYVIFFIIAINTTIGAFQENKAHNSIKAIKAVNSPKTRVYRDDEEYIIDARELVPGDIIILEDGDIVPADSRLIETANLMIDESNLTGESIPIEKEENTILAEDCDLMDRSNMIYSSSVVTYGRGVALVTATGKDTIAGNIATELTKIDELDTPIKRKLNKVAKWLSLFGLLIFIIIVIIGCINKIDFPSILTLAAAIAVSMIPEGLPATTIIIMAMGVQRMAKKNALVRNLPSVETLGSATVICSDKTGTLTMNKMKVTRVAGFSDITEAEKSKRFEEAVSSKNIFYEEIALCGALCNDSAINSDSDDEYETIGDPTEGALINFSKAFGKNSASIKENFKRKFEVPFDSERKRMTTVHQIGSEIISYTKGAIDKILPLCNQILTENGVINITPEIEEKIQNLAYNMASKALRILVFAKKTLKTIPEKNDNLEEKLTFIGLVGISDPPKEEVREAVETCKNAGIRTVMITGDHKVTAMAVAKNIGIWKAGSMALTGKDLAHMTSKELDKIVEKVTVFARVSPHDKLRIIESLKRCGEITAMTGDGVNDVPALKVADIGCAMGKGGTDVAKDASDIVLTDNNFATIVSAVEEGRRVYQNIQKIMVFLLAGCIGEILALLVATVFGWGIPFLPIQVLWGNVITDTFPALALGMEPANENIMRFKPNKSNNIFQPSIIFSIIFNGSLMGIVTAVAYRFGSTQTCHATGQTMTLCVLSLSLLFYSFSLRSENHFIFSKKITGNPFFLWAFICSIFFMGIILFIPPLQNIFKVTNLTFTQWFIILLLSTIPTAFAEFVKIFQKRSFVEA